MYLLKEYCYKKEICKKWPTLLSIQQVRKPYH
jgi:hypothetical protein